MTDQPPPDVTRRSAASADLEVSVGGCNRLDEFKRQ
jgi:hypothetical protein